MKKILDVIKRDNIIKGPITKSRDKIFQGNFNNIKIYKDPSGYKFIIRSINHTGRLIEIPRIEAEYRGVGFLSNPRNTVFYRTYQQQTKTAYILHKKGTPVIIPRITKKNFQLIDFFPKAMNLTEAWLLDNLKAPYYTTLMLHKLQTIHKNGMAIGDRRGGNELILSDGSFKFIDFDIGIAGPDAREFDIAGFFYFISQKINKGNPKRLQELLITLRKFLHNDETKKTYKWRTLISYIKRYYFYFKHDGFYRFNTLQQNDKFVSALLKE